MLLVVNKSLLWACNTDLHSDTSVVDASQYASVFRLINTPLICLISSKNHTENIVLKQWYLYLYWCEILWRYCVHFNSHHIFCPWCTNDTNNADILQSSTSHSSFFLLTGNLLANIMSIESLLLPLLKYTFSLFFIRSPE